MATRRKPVQARGAAKRNEILSAAWEVFRDVGYVAASMDEVTRRAGGSKLSIYSHFGSKAALFEAVVRWRAETVATSYTIAAAPSSTIDECLAVLATAIVAGMRTAAVQDLHRVALSAQPADKKVGKLLYQHGTLQVIRRAADIIQERMKSGDLIADDPMDAAEALFGLLLGTDYIRFALGVPEQLTSASKRKRIGRGVQIFLAAYRADRSDQPTTPI